ncbi:von Willebrand factor D and EGF domain-containing protein-like [Columba livia]|uniref:von Willebrand factor D and EGF domain-containing protein-like n=1 Tax=Columba livia TaxID=8932 RepID=A0A2I0MQX2_COLLI|nr:von Willebrand factor D and EGF domain-containing protein-like [Columba livia]
MVGSALDLENADVHLAMGVDTVIKSAVKVAVRMVGNASLSMEL